MKKLFSLKFLIIVFAVAAVLLIALLLIAPWWAIRYVEKHDREWINRDITIDRLAINPFNVSASIRGVQISEVDSDTTFISFDRLYANLAPWPLLRSHVEIQQVTLDSLYAHIIQSGDQFNFSDLLESGASEAPDTATSSSWTVAVHDVQLHAGAIDYEDRLIGSRLIFDSIDIHVDSFTTTDRLVQAEFRVHQQAGGVVQGDLVYDLERKDYSCQTLIDSLLLEPFTPYVTKGIRLGYFGGQFDADFRLSGNVGTSSYLATNGIFDLSQFKMVAPDQDTLLALGLIHIGIDSLNTGKQVYDFRDVLVEDTYAKFEYLRNGDNFSKWLVQQPISSDTTVEITDSAAVATEINTSNYYASPFEYLALYIYDLTRDYIFKAYSADSVAINNFNLKFYDYTLEDPFYMDVSNMTISAGEIAKTDAYADFFFGGALNRTGTMDGEVLVSREGAENMDIDFEINGLFINGLSPYSRHYTAHPFLEGVITFTSASQIENYYLNSDNRVLIEQVKVGDKRKTQDGYSLPMKLAIVLLRDLDGNVDLKVPIEGPLNDPDYKMGQIIWQVIKNIFTKAATAPFRLLANAFKVNEKDLKNIYFENGQDVLEEKQYKSLNSVAKVLNKKPELSIEMLHLYNREYELDAMAIQRAKLDYLSSTTGAEYDQTADSLWRKEVQELPNIDSAFLHHLQSTFTVFDTTISLPENARRQYGEENLRLELDRVIQKQKQLVGHFLMEERGIDSTRFVIKDLSGEEASINQVRPRFTVQFGVDGEVVDSTVMVEPLDQPGG